MTRHLTAVAGLACAATVTATLALTATSVPGAAAADPDASPAAGGPRFDKPDNRPDEQSRHQTALRREAVQQLVNGKAKTVGKGQDRTIELASGDHVEYPTEQTAQLLTFLVEFGDADYGHAYTGNTAGPLHNAIPEPDANDNSTYWQPDFSREHFMDMFFNGLPDQGNESFKADYKEMSSGRFDLEGDVSDWVKVPNAASYYQSADGTGDEDGVSMKAFLQDAADAWDTAQHDAGKSDQDIEDYLASFDVWDRFDYDNDGNYNEPDGYIDHFQAVHAGEDESAGAPIWSIWAHRSATNTNGKVGPDFNKNGGIEIGNTGYWIRDYTVEPENGGVGVFAHEFAHDLGLPDYYDTQGGDNSTGFWTLMSRGSWMGHGQDSIGTTPNHMGAPDKLFLGWYGNDDIAKVDGTASARTVDLGPAYHSTDVGKQAVEVQLPQGHRTVDVVAPDQGTHYFYSGTSNDRTATATSPESYTVDAGDPTLTARVSYSTEDDWDYAYLKVSNDDGVSWDYVDTNLSTDTDPNTNNLGHGITGCSGTRDDDGVCDMTWTDLEADLSAYAGQDIKIQFEMVNDAAYHELGFSVDSIALGGSTVTDVEDGGAGWVLRGFRVMDGPSYEAVYDRFYIAENKQPLGYEKTLVQGPYSFDYPNTAPNKVDHFPYQDGLLVWYVDGFYEDNDVSTHPGEGYALPVDATPAYVRWSNGNAASGDLNARDATFDVDTLDALHLTSEAGGGRTFDVPARPSVAVFDDTNVNGYWDSTTARSSWYSVKVAGVGSMIQVLSSDENTGHMVVKAGKAFLLLTSQVAITGTPTVGQTLTAVAPTFYQSGVTVGYQWQVGGQPVAGATGSTYVVRPADAGKAITVVATGTKAGYDSVSSTSAAAGTSQSARVDLAVKAPKKVKVGHRAKIKVTLTAAGATPTGKVVVKLGKRAVTGTVVNGKVKVKLPKQSRPGMQKVKVKYLPDAGFAAAKATVKIRFVR
ncbi:MAG TPA: immune inhibitor A domain-containing protein [Nocardioides sp.]|uniref:immune inhibitor A domain-containing protein n=1 Tax=Nocardioides sp. TaxID=35761 RepID=UPI002E37FE56|nr:immune inhibitor A domain-containing protein [Nocardioides sp.]HEX5090353.1 immune inhibitor A domain-containing protein [Nocardioides sp.]